MPHLSRGGCVEEPRPGRTVLKASGVIAGGRNVVGFSLFGINASVVLRFDPETALSANGTREMPCQSVASELLLFE